MVQGKDKIGALKLCGSKWKVHDAFMNYGCFSQIKIYIKSTGQYINMLRECKKGICDVA